MQAKQSTAASTARAPAAPGSKRKEPTLATSDLEAASLDVTEALSSSKYPAYVEYQRRVSRFVPWFPRAKKE